MGRAEAGSNAAPVVAPINQFILVSLVVTLAISAMQLLHDAYRLLRLQGRRPAGP